MADKQAQSNLTLKALKALADPEKLDDLSEEVVALMQKDFHPQATQIAEISNHVGTILDSVAPSQSFSTDTSIAIVLGKRGKVLAANHAALKRSAIKVGDFAQALSLSTDSKARLDKHLTDEASDWTIISLFDRAENEITCLAMRFAGSGGATMIVSLDDEWPDNLAAKVGSIFSLSEAELLIARRLAAGHGPNDIAAERNRSPETVRAQIRGLVEKTETANQAQLLRLLASIRRAADMVQAAQSQPPRGNQFRRQAGRVIDWVEYGPADGAPILFFHGAICGRAPIAPLERALHTHGLRWIAPARPGYGETTLAASPAEAVDEAAADARELLAHLNIERAAVCGYSVGAVAALRFAELYTSQTEKLVLVSSSPQSFDAKKAENMPIGQRALALAAHISPALISMLVRLGIRRLDAAGPEGLGRIVFAGAKVDQKALTDPVVLHHLWHSYGFHRAAQEAFLQDTLTANGGWQAERIPNCEIDFLHGEADQTVPISIAQGFAQKLNARFVALEGVGHLSLLAAIDEITASLVGREKGMKSRGQSVS